MMSNDSSISEEQYQQFKATLKEALEGIAEVIDTTVTKVNETKEGLSIRFPGDDVSPTVYPDEILKNMAPGESPEMLAKALANKINTLRDEGPKMSDLDLSQEGAKKNLFAVVINAEENKELLKDTPHITKDDLAVIARYRVSPEASFIVHDNHGSMFKMTAEEMLQTAMKNTEAQAFKVQPIEEVLREIMSNQGMDFMDEVISETPKSPFYVVTNEMKVDGAIAIMSKSAMEQVYEVVGEDFYILPSSRHEILAVPESMVENPEDLKHMVEEVNATQVEACDKLSDNIYHYDAQTKKVSMVDVQKLNKSTEITPTITKATGRKM